MKPIVTMEVTHIVTLAPDQVSLSLGRWDRYLGMMSESKPFDNYRTRSILSTVQKPGSSLFYLTGENLTVAENALTQAMLNQTTHPGSTNVSKSAKSFLPPSTNSPPGTSILLSSIPLVSLTLPNPSRPITTNISRPIPPTDLKMVLMQRKRRSLYSAQLVILVRPKIRKE